MADTLGEWLFWRYHPMRPIPDSPAWHKLADADRAYWEHEAEAVRRAVDRGGFKAELAPSQVAASGLPVAVGPDYGWRAAVTPADRNWDDS